MRLFALSLCLVSGLALSPPLVDDSFTAKVIGISDGDTIKVLVNRREVTVRLDGIDAPESRQSFGNRAKQALSNMVFGQEVLITKTGEDRYGRTLGVVSLGEDNINATMIAQGFAWHYKQHSDDPVLARLELEARQARRGLWSEPNPLAPWDYRARQRRKDDPPAVSFWLNTASNVRHNQNCEHFQNTRRGRACGPDEGRACGICGG